MLFDRNQRYVLLLLDNHQQFCYSRQNSCVKRKNWGKNVADSKKNYVGSSKQLKKTVQKSETRKKSVLVYIVIFFGSISFVFFFFFFKFKITKVMHRLIHKLSFLLACFHSLNFRIIYYVSVAFFITCAFLIK